MRALTYRNTRTDPRWSREPLHEVIPRGYGYEHDVHYVHVGGHTSGLWTFDHGDAGTIADGKGQGGELRRWVEETFGAEDVTEMQLEVGNVISGVWRPGLYYQDQTLQALGGSEEALRSAEQALRLLVERLDELLLYIEPSANGLASYSHKTRELLILACTEVENQLKQYLRLAGYEKEEDLSMNDYVKLEPRLYLREFVLALRPYEGINPLAPFRGWDATRPTRSLSWYDACNKTKHDRSRHFEEATLTNCLSAVAANIVLFCARWGPFFLLHGSGPLSSLVNQLFRIELNDPDVTSFYVPLLTLPPVYGQGFIYFDRTRLVAPWTALPLTL
jgi:hypothetical protein